MDLPPSLSSSGSQSSLGLSSPITPPLPTAIANATTATLANPGPSTAAPPIPELAPDPSVSVSATAAFLAHEASLSELLISAPATLASEGSAPLQQETIETLSGTVKELASLNQFASQRLKANQPHLTNAVHQLRDLKSDLDLAHRRLFKLILQLKQLDPMAVQMAEERFPLELEED